MLREAYKHKLSMNDRHILLTHFIKLFAKKIQHLDMTAWTMKPEQSIIHKHQSKFIKTI